MTARIEITVFTKNGGPLTKRIALGADGIPKSDGSACIMGRGGARRIRLADLAGLAAVIDGLQSDQAIALGALRDGLPEQVLVVTKKQLNGATQPDLIARTAVDIVYRPGQPALMLFDFDTKGMPRVVADRINALGGFWDALVAVIPELERAGRVIRRSTSAGLKRADTGEQFAGSGGLHGYIIGKDGTDAPRFLNALHDRCWLAGLGWMMIGAAGHLLERSIIDGMVGAAERLVFEGPAIVDPPLMQDADMRRPVVTAGEAIDTVAVCPPLTAAEKQTVKRLKAEAAKQISPAANEIRKKYVADRAQQIVARTGMSLDEVARVIERQCKGVLLADVALPLDMLDDEEYSGVTVTVAHVLDNMENFEGSTLADPIEGIEYGRGKAKIFRRQDGTAWIGSFAHGGANYELRYDARAVRTRIEGAADPVDTFIRLALLAELDPVEEKQLIDDVSQRAGGNLTRAITAKLKTAMNLRRVESWSR